MGDAGPSDSNSNSILTFDDLLRQRAIDEDQSPLLAYPKTKTGVSDYELINGATLNRFVDGAAKCLLKLGFEPVYEETVIGIYAPSDLDYIITIFGLGRLGYTPFLLSPRLPATAVSSLLTTCNSNILFHNNKLNFANSVQKLLPLLKILSLLTRSDYDSPTHASTPEFSRQNLIPEKEFMKKYLMLHSSGSTGLPKPIHYTNKRIIVTFLSAHFKRTFQSVPFSHAHGLVTYVQAIYTRHTLYIMNGHVPQTHKTVTEAIRVANPQVVWTVPYVLKLLAEGEEGIWVLQGAEVVSSSGSRCPDDLGDLLVGRGVNLGLTFGSTETAQILSSVHRPPGDTAWNYLRPLPHVAPYLIMRPVPDSDSETEIYECIILDGHKAKAASNSNDPPNSYHTSDIFEKHPSIENAWKFIGRLDDRITLLNGEKVLPLPVEGRIRQHALVRECVLFGVDRPVPGVLLFRSKNAAELDDQEFIDQVWPIIQVANSNAEGFSQISREMIAVLGEDIECPLTDKSSVKRAQVYREFSSIIDDTYTQLELSQTGSMQLSQPELETWIIGTFEKELGIYIPDAEADFFTAGVDSLKAIQMRGLIIKSLDLGGKKCASMIVYDCGNARKLSEKLYGMRVGEAEADEDEDGEIGVMKKLIEKYSTFETRTDFHRERLSEGITVVLTGATGSLGSHILTELEANQNVKEIYCLLRTTKDESAASRLVSSLNSRHLSTSFAKVAAISADLTKLNFGLQPTTLDRIRSTTTHIIHCAWSVNFALSVQSFEPQLQSLHNLISFSLTTSGSPARLIFCSSVGTAMATPAPGIVSSSPIADLHHASATGYARSKLISEHIIEAAVTTAGANAIVLRIGQIVPARKIGSQLWNPNEAGPLMIRSALAVGALPETVNGHGADLCTWLEADELAKVILEIGGIEDPERNPSGNDSQLVYNVVHPHSFSWKSELLPALKAAGLEFEIVPWKTWLDKMGRSKDKGNPSRKLLGFWETQGNDEDKEGENHEIHFETKGAEQRSTALRRVERVVDGDMIPKLLEAWRKVW